MSRTVRMPFPASRRQLAALGERLRLARKRRKISTVLMAERAGISRDTLHRAEKGDPAVSLGTFQQVLSVLGLDGDLDLLAGEDRLGRRLQDLALDPAGRGEI
ncbi:MAG TPA: helix-turn-helix domain-containing protein [Steroidobacteraceae bacterium]|nr:helix-turn-helix domain-containing protein [Steroidobacteraceae bacterium]HQX79141.1 helix-turn-helix domain-containing protein [Steroidobacteraceae bacterium]